MNKKLKGVGSATLDRGIAIVVGAIVLGGIVAGVKWLYDQQRDEQLYNEAVVLNNAIREYYKKPPYTNISLDTLKKVGALPEDFKGIGNDFEIEGHADFYILKLNSGATRGFCLKATDNDTFTNLTAAHVITDTGHNHNMQPGHLADDSIVEDTCMNLGDRGKLFLFYNGNY